MCYGPLVSDDDQKFQRFNLRLPRAAFEQIVQAAGTSGRSMNAEIVIRLKGSFEALTERVGKLETEVFDGDRGNDELLGRLRNLERDLESLTSYVYRMR